MKRSFLRAIAIIAMVFLLLLAGGCGSQNEPAVVKGYEEKPTVSLSVLTSSSLADDLWDKGFTASDGTRINVVEYSSEYYEKEKLSYRELVLKRLESNVDVDLYIIQAEDVIAFSRLGYWMDLSGIKAVESLSDDALKQSSYDGKVFSIPLSYTGFGLFWNVDILSEHGLSVPGNLPEFLHVCEVLKSAGVTPYLGNKGFALTVPAMAIGFGELYAADNASELLKSLADGTTPVSDYMRDGFEFIEMMIQKGYMDPVKAMDTAPGAADLEDFLAGKGACMCGALRVMDNTGFKVKMTGVPALENGTVSVVGASSRMAINPRSPNVKYAVEMLDDMVTTEWLMESSRNDRSLSSAKGEYDISYLGDTVIDFARLVQKGGQIPNQDFSFPFNTWEVIRDLCRKICQGATATQVASEYDEIQREQIALK